VVVSSGSSLRATSLQRKTTIYTGKILLFFDVQKGRIMGRLISFLSGILSGAVVGASVAILLAPASGKEIIGGIQGRADKVVDDLKSAVERERQRLEAELASLKRGEIQVS
jgi:hypothetical protein